MKAVTMVACWAGEMAQWVTVLANKHDDSDPRIHRGERMNWLSQVAHWSPHTLCRKLCLPSLDKKIYSLPSLLLTNPKHKVDVIVSVPSTTNLCLLNFIPTLFAPIRGWQRQIDTVRLSPIAFNFFQLVRMAKHKAGVKQFHLVFIM